MKREAIYAVALSGSLFACAHHHHTQTQAENEPNTATAGDAQLQAQADEHERPAARHEHHHRMASAGKELPAQPDNTAINQRDRNDEEVTPGDQGNNDIDLDLTQRIRKQIVGDDALSFTAKNVKIITHDGRVTLRGPVNNSAEKETIGKLALEAAGAGHVDNQIEVKP